MMETFTQYLERTAVDCEICGVNTKDDFEIVVPDGAVYGYCLCHDCARELQKELLKEREELILESFNTEDHA